MSISKIFNNQKFSILVDSANLCECFLNIDGIADICLFNEIETIPDNFVFICTNWNSFLKSKEMKNKRILLLPQIAFDNDDKTVIYSVKQLLISDFEYAIKKHSEWCKIFRETESTLHFLGKGSNIVCELRDSIKLSTMENVVLEIGNTRSVAEYFEINSANLMNETNSFIVNGHLNVEGILIAKGVNFSLINYDKNFAKDAVRLVSQASETKIRIQNNRLVSVLIDDVEYLTSFADLVSAYKEMLPNITEFAIGFNPRIKNNINWEFNSQVNEGLEGIHLGIGDGEIGFHLDFITSNIEYVKPALFKTR